MRELDAALITQTVKRLCVEANCYLPGDMQACIENCYARETWPQAREILEQIMENYQLAEQLVAALLHAGTQRDDHIAVIYRVAERIDA